MSTDVAVQTKKPVTLAAYIASDSMKAKLAEVLPKHMTPERMVKIAIAALAKTPKLRNCSQHSVALSLLKASQLGLEPNGRDAHLVPYGAECQLIPDYKGLIQLAYQSGRVTSMMGKAVYELDDFAFSFGTEAFLRHQPSTAIDPGPLVYAWALANIRDGDPVFVVLSPTDVQKRRAKAQTQTMWTNHPAEMWTKSAVHALAKWIPQLPETAAFHDAVQHGDAIDYGRGGAVLDVSPAEDLEALTTRVKAEPTPEDDPPVVPPEFDSHADSKDRRDRFFTRVAKATDAETMDAIHMEAHTARDAGDLTEDHCTEVMAAVAKTAAAMRAKNNG